MNTFSVIEYRPDSGHNIVERRVRVWTNDRLTGKYDVQSDLDAGRSGMVTEVVSAQHTITSNIFSNLWR